jgi:hypothetical protein
MQIHLLVSNAMPVPDDIRVIQDFGEVSLFREEDHPPEMYFNGRHMAVEGTEEAVKNWLRPFDGVWLGKGPPIFQQFEIVHVK